MLPRRSCLMEYVRQPMLTRIVLLTVMLHVAERSATTTVIADEEASDETEILFFRERIEPVLKEHCFACHAGSDDAAEAGLRLDWETGIRRGGDSGPTLIPGRSEDSLLLRAIQHTGELQMPPEAPKLSDDIIADIAAWIDRGAVDPRKSEPAEPVSSLYAEARSHWAFQPLRKPQVPQYTGDRTADRLPGHSASSRIRGNQIDAFLPATMPGDSRITQEETDRLALIRRVTFDLTGLPPTPEEIDVFMADSSPDAYERVVDRLLNSIHFGEKAAQLWLDVVRFAETEGYEYDRHIPDAWRYRDYVIESFNEDKPFDQFVLEQIAGDELVAGDELIAEGEPVPQNNRYLVASIFHRLGPVRRNAGNPKIALSRNEVLTERTDIIGTAFLGMTVGCARCHNHKLEPISQKDYYRLQAYLSATQENDILLVTDEQKRVWDNAAEAIRSQISNIKQQLGSATDAAERNRLTQLVEDLESQIPPPLPTIPAVRNDFTNQTAVHVLKRGLWEMKGERVNPRPLSILTADDVTELDEQENQPRRRLAEWLVSEDNPLTARVIVNRIWQQHFGTGLVRTANDFGLNGERPRSPELLDWLAATLIENGWRLKSVHRMIVLSRAYQDRGTRHRLAAAADGDFRQSAGRRLTAEEIRDAMLAISGRLNRQTGGPAVMVPVDQELIGLLYKPSQWAVTRDATQHDRRSVYLIAKRNLRLPFFENLDAPALQTSCGRRETSVHPPQALELLNGRLSNDLAAAFADRLERECGIHHAAIVDRAFRLGLGRGPTAREQDRCMEFLKQQPLNEFALAIFNLNEFLYVR